MKGKEAGLFDNKALASLILPLFVEQFLAVLVGMADSIMEPMWVISSPSSRSWASNLIRINRTSP